MGGLPSALAMVPHPYVTEEVDTDDREGDILGPQEVDGSRVLGSVAVQPL